MYARRISMKLKPDTSAEFTKRLESDVIPLLRKQNGFQDEIVFADAKGGKEAFAISLWDRKDSADAYQKDTYPKVETMLAGMIDGTPSVEGYDVSASTLSRSHTVS
jgi:heme-degrading monooxygenase HmoA